MEIDLKALGKPFPTGKISWRVGAVSKDKSKAIALAYLDARDVMERLDEVCGPSNWQNKHPHANGKTSCSIGIKVNGEWIWKENGAGDSQVEAEKGAFSDSFKRAAVLWGIGRYLYDVPNIWVEIDESKKFKNPNDPRLNKALQAAEKGIRLENEKEPGIDGNEIDLLKREIFEAQSLQDLEEVKKKLSAAKPRMKKDQVDDLAAQVNGKKKILSAAA